MKRLFIAAAAFLAAGVALRAELPDVTEEAIDELGSTSGTPQLNGFVFVEGRYLSPPYTVTRKGNGIFINRVQIEQLAFQPGAPAAAGGGAARKPGAEDEAAAVAPAETAAPAPLKPVKSIDDLFADEGEAAPAKVEPSPDAPRGSGELTRQKEELRAKLDAARKSYELALGRGEIFFFSERHSRLNGTYGTGRALLGVLPGALRKAQTPEDLQQRLKQGGVHFVDLTTCAALFKHRLVFPLLEGRLRKTEEAEAIEEAARRRQEWPR